MHSRGINGGELRGQPDNPGSPGKMAAKTECVFSIIKMLLGNHHLEESVTDLFFTCSHFSVSWAGSLRSWMELSVCRNKNNYCKLFMQVVQSTV